ncbi:N-acetylmuramoyl-L-alanine amidase [Polymorphobacter sp. PAMC 29334]|uniref:N-acetylmuramoyl-L-alanine amidase n=1 Tax=Polymorphobacter sp. PAMC 29334 TaxID=2862331 RepID=UPI001C7854AC|nr:N-acetylmuramoyl-L-alanine amidase [Polymorphobacter sp. PAMC 29334]QYE36194.1 N-acetylmuramoyl-L-alanine amidase [Polymorphobacter sp. PAMC 29334]
MRALVPVLSIALLAAPAFAARVTGLSVTGDPATVTVEIDGPVETVKLFALDTPPRLVVDIGGADAARRIATSGVPGSTTSTRARIGPFDADTARLVIDLPRPMGLGAAAIDGHALVLRLSPVDAAGFAREVARGRHPVSTTMLAVDFNLGDDVMGGDAAAPPPPPKRPGKRALVVIDPGHGGKDSGTISSLGGYEKNVVLAIALAAADVLRRDGQVRVKMTRDDDTFIPLGERVAIARREKADLFVSVHADSAPNPEAHGASVYTLSETASDVVAARLAARENQADVIAGVDLRADAPEVGDIMIDLVQRSTMNVSVGFAETLGTSLGDRIGFRGEFHHFAGFRVLKAADVPSVLLETGYLSNDGDARLLESVAGQKRIGEGIARAIEAHFAKSR